MYRPPLGLSAIGEVNCGVAGEWPAAPSGQTDSRR